MKDSELPDDDLLRLARVRPDVFATLYERHAAGVHAYLRRRVDPGAAEDLLGEVFAAALTARMRVVPHQSGSALPWLYGIAGNLVHAHLRRTRRGDPASAVGPAAFDRIGDATIDWEAVDDRLDAGSRRSDLRDALCDLTDGERELLLLVAWEGLTPAEAGQALGVSAGVARSRLFRARERARNSLAARHSADRPRENKP